MSKISDINEALNATAFTDQAALLQTLEDLVIKTREAGDEFSASILESCALLIKVRKSRPESSFPVSHEYAAKIAKATLMGLVDN